MKPDKRGSKPRMGVPPLQRSRSGQHKIHNLAKPKPLPTQSPPPLPRPKRSGLCQSRCCTVVFPYSGSGCCAFLFFVLAIMLALYFTADIWFAIFSGLVGPGFAYDLQLPIRSALRTNNWDEVHFAYEASLLLGQSVLVLGSAGRSYEESLVASRGGSVDEIAVEFEKKLPLASGSKWISGSVVYAVIDHPLTNLTATSTPAEYFPFWKCSRPDDILCRNITVEKLLAFRSGLKIDGCERAHIKGLSWESCVERIYNKGIYNPSKFNTFEYGPVGLAVAGLMALKEMQRLPGYENATWQDIFEELILDKANITDAPTWDTKFYDNGRMMYDFQFLGYGDADTYNPHFPDLSASLGCSPKQYAQFAHAFLSRKLFTSKSVIDMSRSHGATPMFYGFDLEAFQGYGQTMWYAGRKISHSVGYYGFFPWIDQSDPDPNNHFFGIIAVNNRDHVFWAMSIVVACVSPVLLIGLGMSGYCCYAHTKRRREAENVLEEVKAPVPNLTKQHSNVELV